jgi:hypothetical protein
MEDVMKKTFAILALLAAIPAAMVMAEGIQEDNSSQPIYQQGHMGHGGFGWDLEEADEVSFTGKIRIEEDTLPVLLSGRETYRLMFPHVLLDYIEIEDGQEIAIDGFSIDKMQWADDDDADYIMVTRATIAGDSYDVQEEMWKLMDSRGDRGGRYSHHDNFGGPGMRGDRGPGKYRDWDKNDAQRGKGRR